MKNARTLLRCRVNAIGLATGFLCASVNTIAADLNAVEYFAPTLNHFFVTTTPAEQAALDSGTPKGWDRTDFGFVASDVMASGLVPVCRFFGTDAYRTDGTRIGPNSHFYTAGAEECEFVKTGWSQVASDGKTYPAWSYEGTAFYVVPTGADGTCPGSTTAVYRAYNNGENGEPNHRFVQDIVARDRSVAAGWISEGIAWCTPVVASPVPRPKVRVVYAYPTDSPFRQDYANAVRLAHAGLADWYQDQTGASTFHIGGPVPERCALPNPAGYYFVDSWTKVTADVAVCNVRVDPATTLVIYADVLHECDGVGRLGAGTPGLTILPRQDLQGLLGNRVVDDCGVIEPAYPATRWIGGLGHEIGHAFGLSHPPGCDQGLASCDTTALMWLGYVTWPTAHLRDDEKAILRGSPFFY